MQTVTLRNKLCMAALAIAGTLGISISHLRAQTTLSIPGTGEFAFGSDARTTYTYPSGDVISYLTATAADGGFTFAAASTTSSTSAVCAGVDRRVQLNAFELTLNSTSVAKLSIGGNSSGAGARYLRALYVNDVLLIEDGNDERVKSFHPGGSATENCADITVEGLNIPSGAKIKVVIGGSATGTPQNFRLNTLVLTPSSALPVRLLSFDAQRAGTAVALSWSAANEEEGRSYTIQRSEGGQLFSNITTLNVSGAGSYRFTDNTAKHSGVLYYRLEMVSNTGKITHSPIRAVHMSDAATLRLLGNPVKGGAVVATYNTLQQPAEARIINTAGTVLSKQPIAAFTNQATIRTDGLGRGMYILQIVNNSEVQTVRFIKE